MPPVSRAGAEATTGDAVAGAPVAPGPDMAGVDKAAGSVDDVTLAVAGALAIAVGGASEAAGFETGGGVTASATCGSGAGNRRESFVGAGGARFGSGFFWISGGGGTSEAVTTSASSTGGRMASTDRSHRWVARRPAISPRWSRQDAPKPRTPRGRCVSGATAGSHRTRGHHPGRTTGRWRRR